MSSPPKPNNVEDGEPDSRAYVVPRANPASYPRKYKDDRKVWLRNIAGAKWYKVAAGRKDSGKWTYQLKDVDKNDELYNGGEWVAETNLSNAGE